MLRGEQSASVAYDWQPWAWGGPYKRSVQSVGMGQEDVLTKAAAFEPIRAAREAISPWLWVFSVVGFGMAALNTSRIAKLYKKWRGKK